jgi:hypothetical protein
MVFFSFWFQDRSSWQREADLNFLKTTSFQKKNKKRSNPLVYKRECFADYIPVLQEVHEQINENVMKIGCGSLHSFETAPQI